MKFSDADYMGIAVGATYSLCNPHLNRKFMNLVWLIGCLSLFCKRIIITRLVVFVILKRLSLLSPTSQIIFSSEHTTY